MCQPYIHLAFDINVVMDVIVNCILLRLTIPYSSNINFCNCYKLRHGTYITLCYSILL